jgi:hypothetical protein
MVNFSLNQAGHMLTMVVSKLRGVRSIGDAWISEVGELRSHAWHTLGARSGGAVLRVSLGHHHGLSICLPCGDTALEA